LRRNLQKLFVLFLCFALFANISYAWPPTYGSEFNFSSPAMEKAHADRKKRKMELGAGWETPGEAEHGAAADFAEAVRKLCSNDCKVIEHIGKWRKKEYRVEFPDRYSFNIAVDPMYVEVQTSPETFHQVKQNEARAQKYIFAVAENLLLTTDDNAHLNIGIKSAFAKDPKGFLRFFSNYHNNAELASGALGSDFANAPPLSHLDESQRKAFLQIVSDVNQKKLKDLETLTRRIQNEVYTSTPTFDAGYHYQGISLKSTQYIPKKEDRPFEFRVPRQPKTAHERTLLVEMMEQRMTFEKAQKDPVVYLDLPQVSQYSDKQLSNNFRVYLAEMNADWEHFKPLLPENLQKIPADVFISGLIDWNNPAHLAVLIHHAPYVASSKWTREKMLHFLNLPEAKTSGKGIKLIQAIEKIHAESTDRYVREMHQSFLSEVQKNPQWSENKVPESEPQLASCLTFTERLLKMFGR
jgi:hypothetical protein